MKARLAAFSPETGLFPWQRTLWDELITRVHAGRLPHAFLLTGARGLGKACFVDCFVRATLCLVPCADGQSCGACRSCLLYAAGNHPDRLCIEPEEAGKAIKVDQVREIGGYMALKSHGHGGYKIVIINPAAQLNPAAANALLKMLEEPPEQSLLILISERAETLMATLRSRCQRIHFPSVRTPVAQEWLRARIPPGCAAEQLLELAGGGPLLALEMAHSGALGRREAVLDGLEKLTLHRADPVAVASEWINLQPLEALTWLAGYIADVIRLTLAVNPPHLTNPDFRARLQKLVAAIGVPALYALLDHIMAARRLLGTSANVQLLLDDMLISVSSAV